MVVALDVDSETFVVYVAILNIEIPNAHLFQVAQIGKLKANKAFHTVLIKYFNYTNIFLPKLFT